MKLVRYQFPGGPQLGRLDGDRVIPLGVASVGALLSQPDPRGRLEGAEGDGVALDARRLLAPQQTPSKMLFCGVNYQSHLEENPSAVLPEEPFFFAKLPSAIVGPGAAIVMPYADCLLDYEVELAVVIGRRAHQVARDQALDHVFGYTLANDVSARDIQFRANQITLGKNPDTFCPLGPTIVPAPDMPDLADVEITTHVNGELRQRARAVDMLFGVAELIERVSALVTLHPGDIVTTGTPAGVACFRDPPSYMKPGDEVVIAATGIGELANPVVAGW